ncbi:MAG: SDR family oxidoreductase [Deltaproteobacteria bacterium]|jgi:NAD(P)-dependent dehydrogenase (short-subunit alcohol dehydrogenase family)
MESGQRVAFISGANRGIGFGLTLEMVQHGCKVAAGYRDEGRSEKLLAEAEEQRNILPVKVDVTIEDDLKHLYRFIENHCGHLNILVNSAGVSINESAEVNELNWEDLARNLEVNVGGPLMISRTLYPLLQRGKEKKIINISSQMGSIQLTDGGATPFRVSKAALNMLSRNQAIEYKEAGIAVVIVHPGWVKTDMGGPAAPMTVAESTRKIFQIIEMISLSNTGEFISVTGDRIPY